MAGKTSGTSSSSATSSSEDGGSGDGRVLVVRERHPVGRGVRTRRDQVSTELTQAFVGNVGGENREDCATNRIGRTTWKTRPNQERNRQTLPVLTVEVTVKGTQSKTRTTWVDKAIQCIPSQEEMNKDKSKLA